MANKASAKIIRSNCDSTFDHYLYSTEYELGIDDHHRLSFRAESRGLWTRHQLEQAHEMADLCNRKMYRDLIAHFVMAK